LQTKLSSLQEAIVSTFVGFVVSLLIQALVINSVWNLHIRWSDNLAIVAIFTVASVLRSYVLRRIFNRVN
jgi:TRAP-type mannitol/chloroaromatic compound transport system permease small subunit